MVFSSLLVVQELQEKRVINTDIHVVHVLKERMVQYDIMIIDRDLLTDLGINIQFSTNQISRDETVVPFRDSASTSNDVFIVNDRTSVTHSTSSYRDSASTSNDVFIVNDSTSGTQSTSSIKRILDANYEPAYLNEIVKSCSHLDENEKNVVSSCQHEHEESFDGTLGKWTSDPLSPQPQGRCNAVSYKAIPCSSSTRADA